jgi:hypothetical protein
MGKRENYLFYIPLCGIIRNMYFHLFEEKDGDAV